MTQIPYSKIAKSLCALLLAVGFLLVQQNMTLLATDESLTEKTPSVEEVACDTALLAADEKPVYKYNVTVEFGALHFYYDWGEWSPTTHDYVASSTSTMPANGVTAGEPGWYGFDGTNNCVKIINHSADGIYVNISYTTPSEANSPLDDGAVTMKIFENVGLTTPLESIAGFNKIDNHYVFLCAPTAVAVDPLLPEPGQCYYLSLSGEPLKDGMPYTENVASIGYLSVSVATDLEQAKAFFGYLHPGLVS